MIDAKKVIEDTKIAYGIKKYGEEDAGYKAPELYEISRQVKALAEVLVDAINEEFARGRPA